VVRARREPQLSLSLFNTRLIQYVIIVGASKGIMQGLFAPTFTNVILC